MNERIKELAEQAKEETDALWLNLTPQEFKDTYNKKFAELIVRETLRVTGATPSMAETAKKHFGVEE
jgi:hypothetical protein